MTPNETKKSCVVRMTKKSIRLDIDESVHANLKAQAALEGVGLIAFLTHEVTLISERQLKRR